MTEHDKATEWRLKYEKLKSDAGRMRAAFRDIVDVDCSGEGVWARLSTAVIIAQKALSPAPDWQKRHDDAVRREARGQAFWESHGCVLSAIVKKTDYRTLANSFEHRARREETKGGGEIK